MSLEARTGILICLEKPQLGHVTVSLKVGCQAHLKFQLIKLWPQLRYNHEEQCEWRGSNHCCIHWKNMTEACSMDSSDFKTLNSDSRGRWHPIVPHKLLLQLSLDSQLTYHLLPCLGYLQNWFWRIVCAHSATFSVMNSNTISCPTICNSRSHLLEPLTFIVRLVAMYNNRNWHWLPS